MASRRAQILTALETRVRALAGGDLRVERNWDVPVQFDPGVTRWLVMLDGSHVLTSKTAATRTYRMEVDFEGYLQTASPAELAAAIDGLYGLALGVVLQASDDGLAPDDVAPRMIQDIDEVACELVITREPGKPSAEFTLKTAIEFTTRANDPTAAG